MPPAVYSTSAAGTWVVGSLSCTFVVPLTVRPGDALVAIFVGLSASLSLSAVNGGTLAAGGWSVIGVASTAGNRMLIARRVVTDAEPVSHVFTFAPGVDGLGMLLVYRGLDNAVDSIPAPQLGGVDVTAATAFPCPSLALVNYSDVYFGVVLTSIGAGSIAAPAGTTKRREIVGDTRSLAVFDFFGEAAGATGTKTATVGTNRTGFAGAFLLPTTPVLGVGKSFNIDPSGAPGFAPQGV